MIPILHTTRLRLRPFSADDLPHLHAMFSSDAAMRFMPTLPHQTEADTQAWLSADMSRNGARHWAITKKGDDTPIGYVNFLGETRIPGMGYMIHPDHWGQGYAPEACRAALDYGFAEIGYDRVELWIDENNVASQRVAHKLGFKLRGNISQKYSHETTHHMMLVFGMLAETWRGEVAQHDTARLFHVEPVLMVHDVAASAHFYRDTLGFQIDFMFGEPPDHAAVSRGEWTGKIVTIQLSRVDAEREITPAGYLYIFMDTNLDKLCEQYRERGVEIVSEPTNQPWGMREFAIRDLSGHLLVFATHV